MAFTVTGGTQAAPITPANIVSTFSQATFATNTGSRALVLSETMDTGANAFIDFTGVDYVYFTSGTLQNNGAGAVIKYGSEEAGRITPGGTIYIANSGLSWGAEVPGHSISGAGRLEWYGVNTIVRAGFLNMLAAGSIQHTLKRCVFNASTGQQIFWDTLTADDSEVSFNGYLQLYDNVPKIYGFRSRNYSNSSANASPNMIGRTQSSSIELSEFLPNVGAGENLRIGNQAGNIVQEIFLVNPLASKTILQNINFWGNSSALKTGVYAHTDIVLDIKDYGGTNEILSLVGVTDATGAIRKIADNNRRPNRAASSTDNLVSGETTNNAIITTTSTLKKIRVQTFKNSFVGTGSGTGASGIVVDTSDNIIAIRNYNYNEEKQNVSSLTLTTIQARLQEDLNVTKSETDAAALLYDATTNPTGISIEPDRQEAGADRPAIIVRKTNTTLEEIYDACKVYHTTEANFEASTIVVSVVNGKLKLGDYTNRANNYKIYLEGSGSVVLANGTKFSGLAPDSHIDFGQPANNVEVFDGGDVTGLDLEDIPATLTGVTADLKDHDVVIWIDTAGSYSLTSWNILNQNGTGKIKLMIMVANVSISTNIPTAVLVNGNADSANVATWHTSTATHSATIEQGDSLEYSSKNLTTDDTVVLFHGFSIAANGSVTSGTVLGKKPVTAAEVTANKTIVPYKYSPTQTGDGAVTVTVVRGATFNAAGDTLTAGQYVRADQKMTAGTTRAVSDDASIEQTAQAVATLDELKPKIEATQTTINQTKTEVDQIRQVTSDTNEGLRSLANRPILAPFKYISIAATGVAATQGFGGLYEIYNSGNLTFSNLYNTATGGANTQPLVDRRRPVYKKIRDDEDNVVDDANAFYIWAQESGDYLISKLAAQVTNPQSYFVKEIIPTGEEGTWYPHLAKELKIFRTFLTITTTNTHTAVDETTYTIKLSGIAEHSLQKLGSDTNKKITEFITDESEGKPAPPTP